MNNGNPAPKSGLIDTPAAPQPATSLNMVERVEPALTISVKRVVIICTPNSVLVDREWAGSLVVLPPTE